MLDGYSMNQCGVGKVADFRANGITKAKVALTDIDGILRGKYMHVDKLESAKKTGFGFCSVAMSWDCTDTVYEHSSYAGLHNGYPDSEALIDVETERAIPWENQTPLFLAELKDPKSPCPRRLLKRVLEQAEHAGLKAKFGIEFEWFNFKETGESLSEKGFVAPKPMATGMFGYSLIRASHYEPFLRALMDEMEMFGVPLEGLHPETGPGVLEAAITYADALEAADRATLFKWGCKAIGHRFGIMPSFMAKWNEHLPGCSGHMHQSLWDKDGRNVFYDARDPQCMSDTFKHYIAGQLTLMPELMAFYAPTVNSYKRLVEGSWAPTRATWGIDNRTCALRVIRAAEKSTRLETRVGGADINAYLAIAASLASGLWGIKHRIKMPVQPVRGNAYEELTAAPFPKNLCESADLLRQSKVAPELFGAEFVDHFVQSREHEWRAFQKSVTSFELARYFEII